MKPDRFFSADEEKAFLKLSPPTAPAKPFPKLNISMRIFKGGKEFCSLNTIEDDLIGKHLSGVSYLANKPLNVWLVGRHSGQPFLFSLCCPALCIACFCIVLCANHVCCLYVVCILRM